MILPKTVNFSALSRCSCDFFVPLNSMTQILNVTESSTRPLNLKIIHRGNKSICLWLQHINQDALLYHVVENCSLLPLLLIPHVRPDNVEIGCSFWTTAICSCEVSFLNCPKLKMLSFTHSLLNFNNWQI